MLAVAAVLARLPQPIAAQALVETPVPVPALDSGLVARYLEALAPESRQARLTPSAALERTARYVAAEFRLLGLRAGDRVQDRWGTNGDTVALLHYPIPGQTAVDLGASGVVFSAVVHDRRGRTIVTAARRTLTRTAVASFAGEARFLDTVMPRYDVEEGERGTVLVAGRHTTASLAALVRNAALEGAMVLYVPPKVATAADSVAAAQVQVALAAKSHGFVVLSAIEARSGACAASPAAGAPAPVPIADDYLLEVALAPWRAAVCPSRAVRELLATNDVDIEALATTPTPVLRPLDFLRVTLRAQPAAAPPAPVTAPVVVATVEGRDSALKDQYVAVIAHLDQAVPGEDASGLAGLLALAEAFNRPELRPRRSVMFVAVSGGRTNYWGSHFFQRRHMAHAAPVLALTLDRLGRGAADSLVIDGQDDVILPMPPAWVAQAHPELGMPLAAGATVFAHTGDHFVFASNNVPVLAVHTVTTGASDTAGPRPTVHVDVGQTARQLRLVLVVLREIANADARPRWSVRGRWRTLVWDR